MNKNERRAQLVEMRRLYTEENLTLQEIGDVFGITKQAVRDRFVRNGVEIIQKRPHKIKTTVNRELLIQLYVTEKLPLEMILKKLGISQRILLHELNRHGIVIRPFACARIRHPELYGLITELKVGDKISIFFREDGKQYSNIYKKAKQLGIKISVARIDNDSLEVTRIK